MIQKTWDRRSEYQVIESMKYFLDGMPRIMQPRYVATPQDILHIRIRSSGALWARAGAPRMGPAGDVDSRQWRKPWGVGARAN